MLSTGSRLGPYEILAQLGAGGMGEVYRARDPRLGREVAIKVLPATFAKDPERLLRFEREAKAASALSHPSILAIYDVGDEAGTPYVVSELLEGETLRDRMRGGPLPTRKAVDFAIQIARGLAAAHEKGIVHRDLKPENLFVTPDGRIKILDFGLAKLALTEALGEKPGQTPSLAPTETGVVLGTAGYMSPEQVRGQPVDHRTDIFSLGAILYEMLSGRRAFEGDSGADKVSAILNADPRPLSATNREISPALEHIVRRCLEKSPAERFHSAHDMAFALEAVSSDSGPVPVAGVAGGPASSRVQGARLPVPAVAIVAALAVLAIAVWLLIPKGGPRLNPNMSFRTLQVPAAQIQYPGISQDGRWVAFPAADNREHWDVYFMNVNGGEARRVTSDSSLFVIYLDISPDGSQIAYTAISSKQATHPQLRVVSALGGPSKWVAEDAISLRWRPDGQRIGFIKRPRQKYYELWSVRPDGSDPQRDFADTLGALGRFSFDWSPDGRSVVWIRSFSGVYEELIVHELKSGRERQLTHDQKNIDEVCWTRQGNVIFSSNRGGNSNLWMLRASGGPAVQITKGTGPDIGMRVSADGKTLLYLQQQPVSHLWVSSFERPNPRQVTHDDQILGSPSMSPDHKRIAVPVLDPDPIRQSGHVYVMNRDGSDRRQVTFGDEVVGNVSWTWDGTRLVYSSWPRTQSPDSASIYVIDADNPGTPRWIGKGGRSGFGWKGDRILLVSRQARTYELPLEGGPETNATEDSTFSFLYVAGRVALYGDLHHDREGIWMRNLATPSDSAAPMKKILAFGNFFASWDGRLLYCFTDPDHAYKVVLPELKEAPYPSPFTGLTSASNGGFSFDNQEIVYTEPRVVSKLVLIENLR